jgi:pantetheine hydrolase
MMMVQRGGSPARLVICLALLCSLWCAVYGDYIGAVVEHTTYTGSSSETSDVILGKNLDSYEGLIALAASKKAQVVVFPEFGLTPDTSSREGLYGYSEVIPEASLSVMPCNNAEFSDRPMLSRMSCAAKSNNISVLVNTVDYVACDAATDSNCPSDKHYQYNTDVVFNENGKMRFFCNRASDNKSIVFIGVLAAKYHKSHEWPGLRKAYDEPQSPSHVTYKASFGVEFGLFICFDIMFEDPPKVLLRYNLHLCQWQVVMLSPFAVQVLRSQGIEHFLYAVSQGKAGEATIIQSWSKDNNAVVLSANLGSGKKDCSGIIVNGTPLSAQKYNLENSALPDENILVATVPAK